MGVSERGDGSCRLGFRLQPYSCPPLVWNRYFHQFQHTIMDSGVRCVVPNPRTCVLTGQVGDVTAPVSISLDTSVEMMPSTMQDLEEQ